MGTPALYMKPPKVSIFQTKWSKSVCVSFKNITKLMSCGVVSGLSLNLSNITQINADVVVGGIKAIWNINLSFRWCLFGFFTMGLCKISLFQNKSCLINVNS